MNVSECNCDVIADVANGGGEYILPTQSEVNAWNVRFDSGLILSYFLDYFTFHVIKRIKNGCLRLRLVHSVRPRLNPVFFIQENLIQLLLNDGVITYPGKFG